MRRLFFAIFCGENMKNRIRKKNLYSRCKLPWQFVKDTKRALAEAKAGKLTPYKYGRYTPTPEERAWERVAPVGREFGSPDYERLTQLDAQADEADAQARSTVNADSSFTANSEC